MKFVRNFILSTLLAGVSLSAGAIGAHADEGRMYEVCNMPSEAAIIAQGIHETQRSKSLETLNLNFLELQNAKRCWAQEITVPKGNFEHFRFEYPDGEGPAVVVVEVVIGGKLKYAVIEEEVIDIEPTAFVSSRPMCEVENALQTYICVQTSGCSCPVE